MQKYFVLAEIFGGAGLIIFVMSTTILFLFYIKVLNKKERLVNKKGVIVSSLVEAIEVTLLVLFVCFINNPYSFSGEGKRDNRTAAIFIFLGIANIAVAFIGILFIGHFLPYFGTYIEGGTVGIAFDKYVMKEINLVKVKNTQKYVVSRHKRKIYIRLSSEVGNRINYGINN